MLTFSCFSIVPAALSSCNISSLLYNQSSGRLLFIGTTWDSMPVSHITHTWEYLVNFPDIFNDMLLFPKCMISEWISITVSGRCILEMYAHYHCKCSTATKRKSTRKLQTDGEAYTVYSNALLTSQVMIFQTDCHSTLRHCHLCT